MDFGVSVKITIITLFIGCQVGNLFADLTNEEIACKKNVGGTDPGYEILFWIEKLQIFQELVKCKKKNQIWKNKYFFVNFYLIR